MPLDMGIVYWVCLTSPCTSFFIPFHFGIARFPVGFSSNGEKPSMDSYDEMAQSPFEVKVLQAYPTFCNFYHKVDEAYGNTITKLKAESEEFEKRALSLQGPLEQTARQLYSVDESTALEMLANYSNGLYLSATEAMDRVLSEK